MLEDHRLDLGVVHGRAPRGVVVPASLRLLPQPPSLDQLVGEPRPEASAHVFRRPAVVLAHVVPDVVAGEVGHLEGPHREPKVAQRRVDVLRQRAFLEQV